MIRIIVCLCSTLALETQQADLAKLLNSTQIYFDTLRDSIHKNINWAKEIVESIEKQHI